jgi:hypothetical protein
MRTLGWKNLPVLAVVLTVALLALGCGEAAPTTTPLPPPLTATPPPMAGKLILYGDIVKFGTRGAPDTCIMKNRFTKGESVGFRMTAIDPLSGKYVETAKLTVHVTYGGKTVDLPMNYRGTGNNPRPGFWTGKWVVPDDAPTGTVDYRCRLRTIKGGPASLSPSRSSRPS